MCSIDLSLRNTFMPPIIRTAVLPAFLLCASSFVFSQTPGRQWDTIVPVAVQPSGTAVTTSTLPTVQPVYLVAPSGAKSREESFAEKSFPVTLGALLALVSAAGLRLFEEWIKSRKERKAALDSAISELIFFNDHLFFVYKTLHQATSSDRSCYLENVNSALKLMEYLDRKSIANSYGIISTIEPDKVAALRLLMVLIEHTQFTGKSVNEEGAEVALIGYRTLTSKTVSLIITIIKRLAKLHSNKRFKQLRPTLDYRLGELAAYVENEKSNDILDDK
jgi:hypothetical protein